MTHHQPERWIHRRWQTETRYYIAEVIQDLWGTWIVRRSWGGIGNRRGSSMSIMADSYDHALILLAQVEKRRLDRNYLPLDTNSKEDCAAILR